MSTSSWPRTPRLLVRFGRLLAAAFALLFGISFIVQAVDDPDARVFAMLGLILFPALGAVVAWFNTRLGGVMLVAAGVILSLGVALLAEENKTAVILLLSAPFLLSGMALLVADELYLRWRDRRNDSEA